MTTALIDCTSHEISALATRYGHVMLVDDDPLHNMVHQQLISKGSFASKTTAFTTAAEALEYLSAAPTEELPSILFLDIVMPEMDGFGFLDAFSKLPSEVTRKCKVVLLSSSESFEHLNKANKNRLVRKFLNKPLTSDTLNAIHI